MGDCQNYGPFLGPLNWAPYYNRDPKRDHNFDNPPYDSYRYSLLGSATKRSHSHLKDTPMHVYWECPTRILNTPLVAGKFLKDL